MAIIGFIGTGNMGYPMLKAAIKTFGSKEVIYTDALMERKIFVQVDTDIPFCQNNIDVVKNCKIIVLAVKPQYYSVVLDEIQETVTKEHIVISIAPGITIETVKNSLSNAIRVIRAMPNTPAMVQEGMSGVCYSKDIYTEQEKVLVDQFFTSFGKYELFEENLMNAVVCANGSSPAYVYMFIEALADSVVKYGIPRDKAYTLVAQTVLGAAKMVLETKEHPGKLKDNVCSPGGTTIAGVAALEENGFRNAIIKATDSCYNKAVSLNTRK